ncbi:BapA prefix-like domain-containing protein [Martelella lutilitoris]|uniref:BapA prefix-like domain-containing protein n=1 Tax=Martelella lutilitoris TaxID=2583532 RepID=A0A5C4JSZ8_9HYPH|nr:Ig-like domain-containing protein [Martelella lutilitoris]TNB48437.1 BapA prefix-like domain-containing protein [Martelella lutilitoris]
MDAIIVDKSDGSQHRQSVLNLQLDEASVVKLPIAPESVASFTQNGDDLVIVTVAGETIVIGDFFVDFDDERNELVLVDDDGIAWWGQYSGPWSDFAFAEIGANSVSPFPFGALGGLGAASAGGLAFSGGAGEEAAASVAEFPVLDVETVADNPASGLVTVSGHSSGDYVVISYPDENGETVVSEPIPVNDDGSWSHDIPRDGISEGDVDVVGTVTDENGNPVVDGDGNPISDTESATFDLTAPDVGVVITDNGQDGTLVLTFSPDTDRDSFNPADDLELDNADLGTDGTWSEDADGNQVWTATITPTGNGEVTATVTDGSYTDTAGNEGSEGTDTETFDVDGPSVVVDIVNDGQTGSVTFTFSEEVAGFEAADIAVENGTLSNLTQVDANTWTATVTPEATGDVTVAVGNGSYTDLAGNPGTQGSDSAAFDRTAPDVGVEITDNGQDGRLVLTFSPDTDRASFDPAADLALENADLGADGTWSEDAAGNQVWTATITPTGNGEVTATVTDGSYTDAAGNAGSEGSDAENFDVDGPSVVVDIVNDGQTGSVTFTFSEEVAGFDGSDVSVGNGTLSNLTQVDANTWTATVTPEATGDVTVSVGNGSYTDLAGNLGTQGSDSAAFDRTAPDVGVVITDNGQDGTLVLTFSPDTDRASFDPAADLALENADLGTDGAWSEDAAGNQVWTATITPTGNGEVTATVTDGSYTDTAGNAGSEGSDAEDFDVDGPSVVVDIVNDGQTGSVTFTFSEEVAGFEAADIAVENGTLSNLTQTGPNTWTATVTPEATGDVTVSVGNGSYTDLAGNPGTPGSDSEAFDRTAPDVGVEITDNGQDGTLVLTFSPDTDRASFDPAADLALENADLGADGTWSEDANGNQVWTATITPTGNGEVTATVTDGSYTDAAGNAGSEGSDAENFDVDGPSVVVDIVNDGQTGSVTFTFSEEVAGFDGSDVSVGNGTLSNLTQVDANTWTATVTPEATGDVTVAVGNGSYTDLAGNPGTQGSDSAAFDRTAPDVGVEITDNGQDGTLVLTFSPDTDRASFDPAADLVLDNADLGTDGAWSEDADGNQVWTATITPTGNGEVTATVTDGSYTDAAGNVGTEGSDAEDFDVDGPSVVVDIDIDDNGLGGDVTFTFSEDVDGFDASDISVNNGTLSNLQQVDDHTWTARVTPQKAGGDLTVTVADESYTDKVGNLGSGGADTEAFERNAPLAHEDDISLQLAGDDFMSDENFNIAFVLDFSGSVDYNEARTMLDAVKVAGQTFFEGTTGDVQIQLVAFSSDARSTVSFTNYADFAAQVDAWYNSRPYNAGTDYTAAVQKTMEAYTPLDGYDNRVFFMSDGEPTEQTQQRWENGKWVVDHSLESATQAAWNDFVADNKIDVQTVGIGQGVTVPRLQDVDEADGDNHVVQVANFDDLVDELLDVLKEVDVAGNVLNGADGVAGTADDDLLGIDGGRILSIDVDGETYTYDQGRIIDHNGNQVEDGAILNVETDQGGRLVFDFETGDWTYTAGPDTGMGEEDFRYVLTDDSGDTSEALLKIDVQEAGATASAARMAIETDSAEDSGEAAGQGVFHAETLGLASIDEAPAEDDDASGEHPAVDDEINVADLVYEDNGESLEAYLPEEKHANSNSASEAQSFSDQGTASIDLNELEDHAMMVG